MTEVVCGKDNCQYSNGGTCTLSLIELDGNGNCMDFMDFLKKPEYQTEYFIVVRACDNKLGRARRFGRKIVINGVDFFTNNSPSSNENHTYITHGRTGYACGTVKYIKENFEEFMRLQHDKPDVMSLPLVDLTRQKSIMFI